MDLSKALKASWMSSVSVKSGVADTRVAGRDGMDGTEMVVKSPGCMDKTFPMSRSGDYIFNGLEKVLHIEGSRDNRCIVPYIRLWRYKLRPVMNRPHAQNR